MKTREAIREEIITKFRTNGLMDAFDDALGVMKKVEHKRDAIFWSIENKQDDDPEVLEYRKSKLEEAYWKAKAEYLNIRAEMLWICKNYIEDLYKKHGREMRVQGYDIPVNGYSDYEGYLFDKDKIIDQEDGSHLL